MKEHADILRRFDTIHHGQTPTDGW